MCLCFFLLGILGLLFQCIIIQSILTELSFLERLVLKITEGIYANIVSFLMFTQFCLGLEQTHWRLKWFIGTQYTEDCGSTVEISE